MKNLHIIPTSQPSRLVQGKNLYFYKNGIEKKFIDEDEKLLNIYITNDEENKEGDWVLNIEENTIFKPSNDEIYDIKNSEAKYYEYCKKIILTTDQDLIKDGVQAIDDEFLEWFVKNPSCEWVDVKKETYAEYKKNSYNDIYLYEIIIPKEEPKQESHICKYCNAETTQPDDECYAKPKQETLEEAAKSNAIYEAEKNPNPSKEHFKLALKRAVLRGAKWQQEISYSEEEVLEIIRQYALEEHLITSSKPDIWFEQFKKK
jgi:hypothetical protein